MLESVVRMSVVDFRCWLSGVWSTAVDRVRGPAGPAVYAFGKHPAFADFIDVAKLPPVPVAFRHFHDTLRFAVERDGGPTEPVLIAWLERGRSAALWVQPSRDRGDAVTGHFRRCPLLLGVAARWPLPDLLRFAGDRLARLADAVMASDGDAMLTAINRAAADWPAAVGGETHPWAAAAIDVAAGKTPVVVVVGRGGTAVADVGMSTVSVTIMAEWIAAAA